MYAYENSPFFESKIFGDSKYLISLLGSFLFFRLITYLARWYFFKNFLFNYEKLEENEDDNTQFSHIPLHKKWRISNEYISLIHALICSVWAIFLIIKFSPGKDIFEFSFYPEMGHMFMMIFGYIISDSIDMISNEWSIRVLVLMFHHTLVSIGCLYPIILKHFGGIVIIGFLMEVNSIFLHTRSLLNYSGYSKAKLNFKMLAFINILTFILFRFIPNLYLIYFITFITNNVPWWETFACCLVSIGLLTTNTVLFYRLLIADNFINGKKRITFDVEEQRILNQNNQLSLPITPFFTAPTTPEVVTVGTQTTIS